MIKKHQMKKIRNSGILHRGKFVEVDIWKCSKCKKVMIIDSETGNRIFLNDKLGEEIE